MNGHSARVMGMHHPQSQCCSQWYLKKHIAANNFPSCSPSHSSNSTSRPCDIVACIVIDCRPSDRIDTDLVPRPGNHKQVAHTHTWTKQCRGTRTMSLKPSLFRGNCTSYYSQNLHAPILQNKEQESMTWLGLACQILGIVNTQVVLRFLPQKNQANWWTRKRCAATTFDACRRCLPIPAGNLHSSEQVCPSNCLSALGCWRWPFPIHWEERITKPALDVGKIVVRMLGCPMFS